MASTDCVFCGSQPGSYARLATHLLHAHTYGRGRVNGRMLERDRGHQMIWYCWCGKPVSLMCLEDLRVFPGVTHFADHLRAAGGLEAHVLQVTLGVPHG